MQQRSKVRVVIVGCTLLAKKVITLVEKNAELMGVVNLSHEVGLTKANYEPLSEFCSRRPDDIHYTKDINDEDTISWIKGLQPDIILQCGWSQIFKDEILKTPTLFCIGIHPAPLPKGRGAAVINWKIIEEGSCQWGNVLFVMEEKTDTGDILETEPFVIEKRDDIRTAYHKVDRTALIMIKRLLPKIADGTFKLTKQNKSDATRYYKRRPEDGLMDINWSAEKIERYVRALTFPYPGAFFESKFGPIIVWKASISQDVSDEKPGTVIGLEDGGRGILIKTGDVHSIWMTYISPFGDYECWADLWAQERNITIGDVLIE